MRTKLSFTKVPAHCSIPSTSIHAIDVKSKGRSTFEPAISKAEMCSIGITPIAASAETSDVTKHVLVNDVQN